MRRAILLLALFSAPALAQNSNTSCYRIGNQVNCNTQTQNNNSVADFWNNYNQQQQAEADRRQRERQFQQQLQIQQQQLEIARQQQGGVVQQGPDDTDARLSREVHAAVGKYLNEGNCDKAVSFALDWGEVALANQAKQFCAKP